MSDAGPVLGFTVSHDAGAAVVHEGRILAAINEERLTRHKGQTGLPRLSIGAVLEKVGLTSSEVRHVVWPTLKKTVDVTRNVIPNFRSSVLAGSEGESTWFKAKLLGYFGAKLSLAYGKTLLRYPAHEAAVRRLFPKATLYHFDHHLCHAACAFYSSGWERCLTVTADAQGDYTCAMVSLADARGIRPICRTLYPHSPGTYYALLTEMMGFVAGRHEGKVVGLAAYGNPHSSAYDEIKSLFFHRDGRLFAPALEMRFKAIYKRLATGYSREDLAAAFQRLLEDVITSWIAHHAQRTGLRKVAVAGGVFANVKLNQRIAELGDVSEVHVFPQMSDGGLAVGGGYLLERTLGFTGDASRLDTVYLDRDYSETEMETALVAAGCNFLRADEIERLIAELLAAGHLIARFNGPMEFGPRALGNRSIFGHAGDPNVNVVLNKKLRRTEFMPFAPLTLDEDAPGMYRNLEHGRLAATFMTMTFECTESMRHLNPAAVHVDGTARPQILDAKTNPSVYRILREYKRLTGNGTIINTSFNVHEDPIVRTPADAIRTFDDAQLDYLAMGPFLVMSNQSWQARPGRG